MPIVRAGVLCIEHADLQVAPVGVYVEQQHALQLAGFLSSLGTSLLPPSAAGTVSGPHSTHHGLLSSGPSLGPHHGDALVAAAAAAAASRGLGGPGTLGTAAASSRAMSVTGDIPSPVLNPGLLTAALLSGAGDAGAQLLLQLPPDLLVSVVVDPLWLPALLAPQPSPLPPARPCPSQFWTPRPTPFLPPRLLCRRC